MREKRNRERVACVRAWCFSLSFADSVYFMRQRQPSGKMLFYFARTPPALTANSNKFTHTHTHTLHTSSGWGCEGPTPARKGVALCLAFPVILAALTLSRRTFRFLLPLSGCGLLLLPRHTSLGMGRRGSQEATRNRNPSFFAELSWLSVPPYGGCCCCCCC